MAQEQDSFEKGRTSVAEFKEKHGEFGMMVLGAFNEVDPFGLKPFDFPEDEYLSRAKRFMEMWEETPEKEKMEPRVRTLVFGSFSAKQFSGECVHEDSEGNFIRSEFGPPRVNDVKVCYIANAIWAKWTALERRKNLERAVNACLEGDSFRL